MREILYGRNAVKEVLRAGRRRFYKLLLARGMKETGVIADITAMASKDGVPIQRLERRQLDGIGDVNHQGVAAEVSPYPYVDLEDILAAPEEKREVPLLLLLDCLQDPQNLGTLLRTAEAVRVHGVVIPHRRTASITPAVVNSSAGAVEHLLVARVTNLVRTMEKLKERGLWIVGLENVPEAKAYHEVDLNVPLALVVGSEGRGMRRLVRKACDFLIRLPMRGQVGSLNAAVAGSIALYEVQRQKGMVI
ncbi:MAG: 23S rRNA (guanosine(2251)-2'-O)-methyltransferase RlmB [Chloroflexota bacterium]|nr:23S rRNA (guanosine(2251)-2'-O)-methyltransferase RlmB [Chloroflexota bacterium]